MFGMIPYTNNLRRISPIANEFFKNFFETDAPAGFRVDVRDEGDRYMLEAELPGVKKEDVKVTVENGVMTVSADMSSDTSRENGNYVYRERRCGTMRRSFSLDGINEDALSAEYRDGVLRLTLPKLDTAPPAKREIPVM